MHWDEADGPTECVFVQNQDFKAYLWEAFMPTPAYAEWLLQTDMSSAYAYERMVLQVLQSRAPGTWSLKMPSHAVHIETLLATYPDVRIVWAHRDPFKSTASFLRLNYLSRAVTGCRRRRRGDRGKCAAPVEGTRRPSAGDPAPDR